MSRRIVLPDPTFEHEYLRRLVAELTLRLNEHEQRISDLEADLYVEDNLLRPPRRDGALAVVGSNIYVGAADNWVQVN